MARQVWQMDLKPSEKEKENIIVRTPPRPLSIAYFTALNTSLNLTARPPPVHIFTALVEPNSFASSAYPSRPFILLSLCRHIAYNLLLRQHFVVFFSLLYPDVADVEGRFEKLLTAREFCCSADVSNWSCFFTPFIFFLVESLCAHNLHPSFTADNVCRCLLSSFENKIPSKL